MDSPLKIEKALPRSKEDGAEGAASPEGGSDAPKRKGPANKRGKKQTSSSQKQSGSIQPDPRWADELAKLKEMLASANN